MARGVAAVTLGVVITAPQKPRRAAAPRPARPPRRAPSLPPQPVDPVRLAARWRAALDAAELGLGAAGHYLSAGDALRRRSRLASERAETLELLRDLARGRGADRFLHLTPVRRARAVLALPADVTACVFDLEGVLTGSAELQAAAWEETFGEFLAARAELRHEWVPPFHARTDYPAYLEGRLRVDGVRELLASRGIRLPEGRPDDPPEAETVHGLANRKRQVLLRRLDEHGPLAFAGVRSYLELAHEAGIACAVVSASATTGRILERAGLSDLVDGRVDAVAVLERALRPRPAPDMLLDACRRIGAEARRAAVFETTAAGVEAARTAAFRLVVGVDRGGRAGLLAGAGADLVVSGLDAILDRTLSRDHERKEQK